MKGDKLEVSIPNHGRVLLKRQTWSKRDRKGSVVGSRTQFPVIPRAVVHCSKEFVPGLIYVAISRVRHPGDLQVRKFKASHLLKPPADALNVCDSSQEECDDLTCCRNQHLSSKLFSVGEVGENFGEEDGDAHESLPVDPYPDGLVQSYFERDEDDAVVDLGMVYLALDDKDNQFQGPPSDFNIVEILNKQKVPEPMASSENQFCKEKNEAISNILTDSVPHLRLIALILWYRIFHLLGDHLASNADEAVVNTMLRKHLTDLTHHVYVDIIGMAEYRRELRALFQVDVLSEAHLSIGSELCIGTFTFFVHLLASKVDIQHQTVHVNFDVSGMPSEGLAKLRHVGGWAVRKELERCRRFIRQNMYSQNAATRQNVNAAHAKCELLEDNIIVQFAWLEDNTSAPETLEVTEDRQYRERGLLHISDEAFGFFKILESLKVQEMNMARLVGSIDKARFTDTALETILNNPTLASAWRDCFKDTEPDKEVSIAVHKVN